MNSVAQKLNKRFFDAYKPKQHRWNTFFMERKTGFQTIQTNRTCMLQNGGLCGSWQWYWVYLPVLFLYQRKDGITHQIVPTEYDGWPTTVRLQTHHGQLELKTRTFERSVWENTNGPLWSYWQQCLKTPKVFQQDDNWRKGRPNILPVLPFRPAVFLTVKSDFCSNTHDFLLTELDWKTNNYQPIFKPDPIVDYNKYMEGVDLAD